MRQKRSKWQKPSHHILGYLLLLLLLPSGLRAQAILAPLEAEPDSLQQIQINDSINQTLLEHLQLRMVRLDSIRVADSIAKVALTEKLQALETTDNLDKQKILQKLEEIRQKEAARRAERQQHLDSLRHVAIGYPILGVLNDTIDMLYVRMGSFPPEERAKRISRRVRTMYDNDFSTRDTLYLSRSEGYTDIMYYDQIVMTVSDNDALWNGLTTTDFALQLKEDITASLLKAREENSLNRLLHRTLLVVGVVGLMILVLFLLSKIFRWVRIQIRLKREVWFKDLKYKDYTFINTQQEEALVNRLITILHWGLAILLFVIVIPIIFSFFPFARGWSQELFSTIWRPFRNIFIAIWEYLPKLLNILIIYIVLKYLSRLLKYFFNEIKLGKLKLPGFHPDFAPPSYAILRVLIVAFGIILIFPYLPGAGSEAFNGVSVFVGLLVSLGSSSAIANMIAGIVITYMRPFKVGDRIKVDGIMGDVTEKTLLVTKLKQVTNEEVTIPNSKILNSNTINYSTLAETKGLILSTEVTFGYEVPWQKVEEALITAAQRCPRILAAPKPFVLQMGFHDFYVIYTINAYTTEANAQASIYSEIRGHIQEVCREQNLELLSPYYQANRDGSQLTIPPEYHKPAPEEKKIPKVHEDEGTFQGRD